MFLKAIVQTLEDSYTSASLKLQYEAYKNAVLTNEQKFKDTGLSPKAISLLQFSLKGNPNKKTLVNAIAPIFQSPKTFLTAMGIMAPKSFLDLLSDSCLEQQIDLGKIKRRYGIDCYTTKKTYYDVEVFLSSFMGIFQISKSYTRHSAIPESSYTYMVSIPSEMKPLILGLIPRPENTLLRALKEEEISSKYKLFSAEKEIPQAIANINEAIRAGMLKLTNKGEASEASVKKLQSNFNIQEWYSKAEAPHKFMHPMRTRLLIQLILTVQEKEQHLNADPIQALKQLLKYYKIGGYVANYTSQGYQELAYLLPHLKGHRYVMEYNGFTSVASSLIKAYTNLLPNQWVAVENLRGFMSYGDLYPKPVQPSHAARYLYYYDGRYKEKSYIDGSDYEALVMMPMLKGSLALLASFGMIDIAYDTPEFPEEDSGHISYFEGIRAVKLNPLGQYLLGLTKEYELAAPKNDTEVIISSEDLMLLLSEEDAGKEKTLAFYSQQISPVRFNVSSASFLKDCKTKADLKERISTFKFIVNQEKLPLIWEHFFKDLLNKALTLEEVEEMVIYQLPQENIALLKLIATHPSFQKVIHKADGYKILVEKKQVRKFKSLLSAEGYLLS